MWPFKRRELVQVDNGLLAAMQAKDPDLFAIVGPMTVGEGWREWKRHYPEDFPLDGMSPVSAASIMPKQAANG